MLHWHDGPAQDERDNKFRAFSGDGENPDLLVETKAQSFLWGYDPEKEFIDNINGTSQVYRWRLQAKNSLKSIMKN